MFRNWLALIGLLFILAAVVVGLAWAPYSPAIFAPVPDAADQGFWKSVQTITGISPDQAFTFSLVGLLLGIILTIPWWRERLRQEGAWWHRSDGPVKGPPKAGV